MVKHTTAWVKEPALALMHALEKRAEAQTSTAVQYKRAVTNGVYEREKKASEHV
jgi:hypothetical protein